MLLKDLCPVCSLSTIGSPLIHKVSDLNGDLAYELHNFCFEAWVTQMIEGINLVDETFIIIEDNHLVPEGKNILDWTRFAIEQSSNGPNGGMTPEGFISFLSKITKHLDPSFYLN